MQREVRGRRIGFDDRGSGEPVVLLHPFPFDSLLWAGLRDALAARRRVIAVDARGFGESPLGAGQSGGGDAGYQIAELADDVAGLLDGLSIARATVVGMSMGGYTALALAARHPARLHGLVLADTRAAADTPEMRGKRDQAIAQVGSDPDHGEGEGEGEGTAAYLTGSLPRLLSPQAPPALAAHLRARAERRPASLIAGLRAMRDRPDRSGELAAIATPTLVLCGAREQVVPPAEMRAMSAAIPGARYEEIPEAGHLAHLEAPGRFEIALGTFLDELAGAARAAVTP